MKDKRSQSDNELLQEISSKLTQLTAMLGMEGRDKEGQIKYLVNFGLSISEISRLTGYPEGTIKPIRARLNKS